MDIYKKIQELVEMMQNFDLTEIEIKDGEKEIKLRKGSADSERALHTLQQMNPLAVGGIPAVSPPQAQSAPGSAPASETPPNRDPNLYEYKSPMVGTFYRAPSPESPPFATEGDKVQNDSILCIIEAMKVMNEIRAEVKGEVVEVLVENGEAVEFGQPLFLIRRAG